MHTLTIDASPKQINKLKKGNPVRIKKGTGFNLIVHPETYKRVARTYDKNKGFQLTLSQQEIEANQGLTPSPEMHEMKSEALPPPPPMIGKGIFDKSGLKGIKVNNIKEQAEKVLKDTKLGNVLNSNFNYLGRAGLGNALSNANNAKAIKDQIKQRINLEPRNMSSGPKQGNMDYVQYLRNPDETLDKLQKMIMGEGLMNHREHGSIGLKGGMIHPYTPQAMQSQPYGANFQMQHFLPPQYHKFNSGTSNEGVIGTGLNSHPSHIMTHLPPALQSQPHGANFLFKNFLPVQFQQLHQENPYFMAGTGIHQAHNLGNGLYASGRAPGGRGLYI